MRSLFAIRWIDDCRTRRTILLLGIIWMLGLFDLYFTRWAYQFTEFEELNPWASRLLSHHELTAMTVGKVVLVVLSSAAFWVVRKHRLTESALWVLAFMHVWLIFRWSTYTSNALDMWADCPEYAALVTGEPIRIPPLEHQEMAGDQPTPPAFSALQPGQAPRVSGVPAALFLEKSPQNWPKPRT